MGLHLQYNDYSTLSSLPQGSHEIARCMRITRAFRAQIGLARRLFTRRKSSISTFKFLNIGHTISSLGSKTPRITTPGLEPDVQSSHGAVDQSSQNSMAVILKGLNDTLAQLTKASEK